MATDTRPPGSTVPMECPSHTIWAGTSSDRLYTSTLCPVPSTIERTERRAVAAQDDHEVGLVAGHDLDPAALGHRPQARHRVADPLQAAVGDHGHPRDGPVRRAGRRPLRSLR